MYVSLSQLPVIFHVGIRGRERWKFLARHHAQMIRNETLVLQSQSEMKTHTMHTFSFVLARNSRTPISVKWMES